jgi:3-oxoacyl-[acyl-carrier-protein] synthase III
MPERQPKILTMADIQPHIKHEVLRRGLDLSYEVYRAPNGMVGVAARPGIMVSREAMNTIMLSNGWPGLDGSDFEARYSTRDGDNIDIEHLPEEYARIIERSRVESHVIGERLLEVGLEKAGLKRDQIDALYVVNSMGDEGFAEETAKALHIREGAKVIGFNVACNGSAAALLDALQRPELHGRHVAILAVDMVKNLMPNNDRLVNPAVMKVFGNGAGLLLVTPGRHLNLITGRTEAYFDKRHGIEAKTPSNHLFEGVDGFVLTRKTRRGEETFIKVKEPENGAFGHMSGGETFSFFVTNTRKLLGDVLADYREQTGRDIWLSNPVRHHPSPDLEISEEQAGALEVPKRRITIVTHHPSPDVARGIENNVRKELKLELNLDSRVPDANSVSSTFMIALARTLSEIKPGEDILILSMGVGGLFTAAFLKVGEGARGRYRPTSEKVAA